MHILRIMETYSGFEGALISDKGNVQITKSSYLLASHLDREFYGVLMTRDYSVIVLSGLLLVSFMHISRFRGADM